MKKIDVVERKVEDLIPRPGNEKAHPPAQIDQMIESIRTYGFNDPLEITPDGEVIAGNGRLLAAKKMGLETVPCIVHEHLSADDVRAYGVVHNQATLMTGLDMDMVADEFDRLNVTETDYSALGFTADEVIFMMPEQRDIMDDEDIRSPTMDTDAWSDLIPKVVKTRVVFEDQLGKARFEQFAERLRDMFPHEVTMADRISAYLTSRGVAEEAL